MSQRNCWTSYFLVDNAFCRYRFVHLFDDKGEITVHVDRNQECSELNVLAIGLGLTGAIIAIGIALLVIWRILAYLYDKKEYARFLEETKAAKFTSVCSAVI